MVLNFLDARWGKDPSPLTYKCPQFAPLLQGISLSGWRRQRAPRTNAVFIINDPEGGRPLRSDVCISSQTNLLNFLLPFPPPPPLLPPSFFLIEYKTVKKSSDFLRRRHAFCNPPVWQRS